MARSRCSRLSLSCLGGEAVCSWFVLLERATGVEVRVWTNPSSIFRSNFRSWTAHNTDSVFSSMASGRLICIMASPSQLHRQALLAQGRLASRPTPLSMSQPKEEGSTYGGCRLSKRPQLHLVLLAQPDKNLLGQLTYSTWQVQSFPAKCRSLQRASLAPCYGRRKTPNRYQFLCRRTSHHTASRCATHGIGGQFGSLPSPKVVSRRNRHIGNVECCT
ncbi:hypothetical protein BD289DRAFT_269134 [Coniella lustricola]|uniref:Uncharacterized protein n=1 Tax=Coniella lustricola TaxID=2025994 RepID=A0A2T3AK83_9PEZI|nr:hypothetical protein BD289DRAFT_269134 [Coniella lustricola]